MATACEGLKVVEFAGGMASQLTGMILADNGAQVLVVEPPGGSPYRKDPGFLMLNRGKSSLELDLKTADGRAQAQGLATKADAVITAWRLGVAERLGLAYDALREANPRLVYCAISGFGAIERLSHVRGYEHVVSAAIGKMCLNDDISGHAPHRPPEAPIFTAGPANCYGAANLAVQGILAALLERDESGEGQLVTTSLFQGAFATHLMRKDMHRGSAAGQEEHDERFALRHRGVRLAFLTVECADGKWIQMCARQDHHFRNWLKVIGLEEALAEPRYRDVPLGFKSMTDADELEARIRERMKTRPQADWMRIFVEDVDVGDDPFLTFDEFLDHPQLIANERVLELDDPEVGRVKQLGPLALLSDTPSRIEQSAPRVGERRFGEWAASSAPGQGILRSTLRMTEGKGPLAGVTILELATFVAGPWVGAVLAELGARVIKVEPLEGDSYRRSGTFVHLAHGKESVALDLKHPKGQEVLRKLLTRCDALLENYRPGVPERLGFGYETVHQVAPEVVYCYAASYGSRGPQSHRAAFHSTPNALCGAGILQAGEGNPPVDDSYPDPTSAIAAATAILLGLHARRATGQGQYIETSMICSAGYVFADELVSYAGRPPRRAVDGDQHGYNALYRLYELPGDWLFLAAPSEEEWQAAARVLGHPEWLTDGRFTSAIARTQNDAALVTAIQGELARRSAAESADVLQRAGVAAVPVNPELGLAEFLVDEGLVAEGDHPDFGAYWKNLPLLEMSRSQTVVGPPCGLGEHTAAVLGELGYSETDVQALADEGVVKMPKPAAALASA